MAWNALSAPWRAAFAQAMVGYLNFDSAPIGAVVTDAEGRIVLQGHNNLSSSPIAHAEMLALSQLGPETETSTLVIYTTLEPCPMCAGAIRMCRLSALHFAARDPSAGFAHLLTANDFMRSSGCHIHPPDDPALEAVVIALNVEFRLRSRRHRWRHDWLSYHPSAADAGDRLAGASAHARWKSSRASVELIYKETARLLAKTGG